MRRRNTSTENWWTHLLHQLLHVDEVTENCEVCRASDRALHVPINGTSTAGMLNTKLQVDLPFLDDLIALSVMDLIPKYLLVPARSKNTKGV